MTKVVCLNDPDHDTFGKHCVVKEYWTCMQPKDGYPEWTLADTVSDLIIESEIHCEECGSMAMEIKEEK